MHLFHIPLLNYPIHSLTAETKSRYSDPYFKMKRKSLEIIYTREKHIFRWHCSYSIFIQWFIHFVLFFSQITWLLQFIILSIDYCMI